MILPERAIFFTTRCAATLSSQYQDFDRTLFPAYHPHTHTTFDFHSGESGSVRTITLDGYVVNMKKTDHAERTVGQPRDQFLPGQWLDVYVPGIDRPGGFTITSSPSKAQGLATAARACKDGTTACGHDDPQAPYLELAVKDSPDNAVAQWLWKPADEILSRVLQVRVGGSFVWPPPGVLPMTLRKIVFVAGGVGINPLMSIVSHLAEKADPRYTIEFLYSVRDTGGGNLQASDVLFLEQLAAIFSTPRETKGTLRLFLTNIKNSGDASGSGRAVGDDDSCMTGLGLSLKRRRITSEDVADAIGEDKRFAVVYVCGVPAMTDEFVEKLTSADGLGIERHRVLYEKWW